MILDTLLLADRYLALAAGLDIGFEFLRRPDLASLDDGRHEIDGERVFAIVARGEGRGADASPLEFHRRFLDIQYVVAGTEVIGWSPLQVCEQSRELYNSDKDIGFFDDQPQTWLQLEAGSFTIFFPNDVHAPLAGHGPVHKVVIKVAI